jgi:hypothetical protein
MEAGDPTLQQLRELVQQACRDNPHLTSRLERAAFLVLLRPIRLLGDHHYQIGSEDGLRIYEVLNGHCQCHDYIRHGAGHPCKHRLALALLERLQPSGLPMPPRRGSDPPRDPLATRQGSS